MTRAESRAHGFTAMIASATTTNTIAVTSVIIRVAAQQRHIGRASLVRSHHACWRRYHPTPDNSSTLEIRSAYPKPPVYRHLVMHKVEAPALVWQRVHRCEHPSTDRPAPVASSSDHQPLLSIQALSLLPVDHHAPGRGRISVKRLYK